MILLEIISIRLHALGLAPARLADAFAKKIELPPVNLFGIFLVHVRVAFVSPQKIGQMYFTATCVRSQ